MNRRKVTVEIGRMLDNEAYRRARGDHISERTSTKELAVRTGLTAGYIANIIARKRREYERKLTFHVEQKNGP